MTAATVDEATDTALWLAVDEALEDGECCGCHQAAEVRLIIQPCGCGGPFCNDCRRKISRTFTFREKAGIGNACRGCHVVAWDIAWTPL